MLFARLEAFPNYRIYLDGRVYSEFGRGRFMKPWLNSQNYWMITVCTTGKPQKFRLHRLLAMCFIPCNKNFSDMQVDHINIDKNDNRLENLRWLDCYGQQLNQKYKETNTGYPFIYETKNKMSKSGFQFCCKIMRNGKCVLANARAKLEDAVELVRQFILDNNYIFDGYSRETIEIIKERYKL